MNDALYKATVLVLNRNWQAIDVKTPAQAFCMMANGNATGLDIQGIGDMRPVRWNEWLELAVREDDNAVRTVRGLVRIPTVLVLARYNKVPKRRPKLSTKAFWDGMAGDASTPARSWFLLRETSIMWCRGRAAAKQVGKIACWPISGSIA